MADKRRTRAQRSEKELDQLAEITPADIEHAKQAWHEDARPQYKDLLDAEPDESEPLP